MEKLYEIAEAIKWSVDNIEDEETKEGTLELLADEIKHKSVNLIHVNNELERQENIIDEEIKRLKELKSGVTKKKTKFLDYIEYCMRKADIKKVETDLGTITTRKSESVNITDKDKVPCKYKLIEVIPETTVEKIPKDAIKKAIKNGEIVEGAELITKLNVKFK